MTFKKSKFCNSFIKLFIRRDTININIRLWLRVPELQYEESDIIGTNDRTLNILGNLCSFRTN